VGSGGGKRTLLFADILGLWPTNTQGPLKVNITSRTKDVEGGVGRSYGPAWELYLSLHTHPHSSDRAMLSAKDTKKHSLSRKGMDLCTPLARLGQSIILQLAFFTDYYTFQILGLLSCVDGVHLAFT
jgi:hypothetical protein